MDFDDEVSSVSVDVADLMQATVLVMTGFIVSSVASQAVRRRDCSLLGVELIGLQCLALFVGDGTRTRFECQTDIFQFFYDC